MCDGYMVWNFLISILCLAGGGLVGWLILNPKLLRARSQSAVLGAALEMAKDEIVILQSDLEGAGKSGSSPLWQGRIGGLHASRSINEVEKERRRATQEPLNSEEFRTKLFSIIDAEVSSILESKRAKGFGGTDQPASPAGPAPLPGETKSKRVLEYADALILTASIRGIFAKASRVVPEQVEVACLVAEAFLAPTAGERRKLVKKAAQFGGVAGIGFVVTAACAAVGAGHGGNRPDFGISCWTPCPLRLAACRSDLGRSCGLFCSNRKP